MFHPQKRYKTTFLVYSSNTSPQRETSRVFGLALVPFSYRGHDVVHVHITPFLTPPPGQGIVNQSARVHPSRRETPLSQHRGEIIRTHEFVPLMGSYRH